MSSFLAFTADTHGPDKQNDALERDIKLGTNSVTGIGDVRVFFKVQIMILHLELYLILTAIN